MKLKALTKPISHTAVTKMSAGSRAVGRRRGVISSAAIPALPTHCRTQAPDGGQATQVIDEAQGTEEADGRTERDGLGPADQDHGHQQPGDDRKTAAARRRDRV